MKPKTTKSKAVSVEDRIRVILEKVRPFIKSHGGGVELSSFSNGEAVLEIQGACVGCHLADLTYNQMIGSLLKEKIPAVKKISLISNKVCKV